MAVAAKNWLDRVEADPEALSVARSLVAVRPVQPAFYPPIKGVAVLVPVGVEPMLADVPEEAWTAEPDPAYIGEDAEYRNAANDRAAMRQHLAAATEWGGQSNVAALVMVAGVPQPIRLVGTEAAIRQALPDADTVAAWKAAGVTEFPMQLDPGEGALRRITWVPIDQVPTILQLERAWRGAADA